MPSSFIRILTVVFGDFSIMQIGDKNLLLPVCEIVTNYANEPIIFTAEVIFYEKITVKISLSLTHSLMIQFRIFFQHKYSLRINSFFTKKKENRKDQTMENNSIHRYELMKLWKNMGL